MNNLENEELEAQEQESQGQEEIQEQEATEPEAEDFESKIKELEHDLAVVRADFYNLPQGGER